MFVFTKDTQTQVFPVDIVKFLITGFFIKTLRCLLLKVLPQYSKVSWGNCWIHAFTCVQIWLKTYTKCCTNNSLLSSDKTISFLLEMTYNMLSISECFGKTLAVFYFDEKLTKLCTKQQCVKLQAKNITGNKTSFACTLQLINFRSWFGKWMNAV